MRIRYEVPSRVDIRGNASEDVPEPFLLPWALHM